MAPETLSAPPVYFYLLGPPSPRGLQWRRFRCPDPSRRGVLPTRVDVPSRDVPLFRVVLGWSPVVDLDRTVLPGKVKQAVDQGTYVGSAS